MRVFLAVPEGRTDLSESTDRKSTDLLYCTLEQDKLYIFFGLIGPALEVCLDLMTQSSIKAFQNWSDRLLGLEVSVKLKDSFREPCETRNLRENFA